MSSVSSIALGLVVLTLAVAGCAHSGPTASPERKADNAVLKACVFRTVDEIAKSPECTARMTAANITSDDLAAIKQCMSMPTPTMYATASCLAQKAKHPGVF
jgi:hypothetical protein